MLRLAAAVLAALLPPFPGLPAFLHAHPSSSPQRQPPQAGGPGPAAPPLRLVAREVHKASKSWRRPIITGCYKACGHRDQTCVTGCQVCVEDHGCRSVHSKACRDCRREAHKARRESRKASDLTVDSGGAALQRDAVRMRLERAKLESVAAERRLQEARAGVLNAQRQAEYAVEEREAVSLHIKGADMALKQKRQKTEEWTRRNAKLLMDKQEEAKKHREALRKTRRQLRKAKERLHEVRNYDEHSKNHARWRELLVRAEGFVRKLQKKERRQLRDVQKADAAVNKQEQDNQWVERGLNRGWEAAKKLVDEAKDDQIAARTRERISREALEEAKRLYHAEAGHAERRRESVKRYQKELYDKPLPVFKPQALDGSIPGIPDTKPALPINP